MLSSKILKAKKIFSIFTGESIIDIISSTFRFGESPVSAGTALVNEYEIMRPDLVSQRIYSTQEYWDCILKYNGISNPFSIDIGEILIMPAFTAIESMIVPPRNVTEKGIEPSKKNESKLITPKTPKDKQRLASIRTKVPEIVPPNVNLTGAKNVRVVDGLVIFGADMTSASSTSANSSTVRSRVQSQLTDINNF